MERNIHWPKCSVPNFRLRVTISTITSRLRDLDMLICRFILVKEPNRTGKNRNYFSRQFLNFSSAFLCFFLSILLIFINFHFTAGKSSTPVNPKRSHSGLPFLTDIRNFLSSFVKDSLIEDTRVLRVSNKSSRLMFIYKRLP